MPLPSTHDTIKRICGSLFTAEERRLALLKQQMVERNAELNRDRPHDGFMYQGKPYDRANLIRGPRKRISLHNDLVDEMDEILKDEDQVWTDRHLISQTLFQILHFCDSQQDVRDALPECLVDTLPELKSLKRCRDAAYPIRSNNMLYRQFQRVLPRIEFYSAARMLY